MRTATLITYAQFDAMIEQGVFDSTDDRFELLLGRIVRMPWPKPPHDFRVDELTEWSFEVLPPKTVRVRVNQPLGIPELDSLTLPDLAWMRRLDYSEQRPMAEDVLLVIEVAHTTLSKDRKLE